MPSDEAENDDLEADEPVRLAVAGGPESGLRLDKAMAQLWPDWSRARLRDAIEQGAARLNGRAAAPRATVVAGDRIELDATPRPEQLAFRAEPIPLAIRYEDRAILVIDKPAGLVVHPAAGHWSGTLLNGLLAHDPQLAALPRAGIVHRLDAETSGLMVVARTAAAQLDLVRQLQQRTVTREYWAIVYGSVPAEGSIDAAIGRDRRNPRRFSAGGIAARAAVTHYRRAAAGHVDGIRASWVVCRLETGRTHQIRVHLESIGHPLVGDPVYRQHRPAGATDTALARQALHAARLALRHPDDQAQRGWFAAPPPDLAALMDRAGFGPLDRPSAVFE